MPSTQVERPTASVAESACREPRPTELNPTPGSGFEPSAATIDEPGRPGGERPERDDLAPSTNRSGTDLPLFVIRLMIGLGRGLIVVGVLLLLFAAFQLWGTGFSEARAQADLADRFEQQLQDRADPRLEDAATVGPAESVPSSNEGPEPLVVHVPDDPAAENNRQAEQRLADQRVEDQRLEDRQSVDQQNRTLPAVELGDPIGVLRIPAIDVEKTIAEGTTRDVLRSGPGHYPSTPRPGQRGNVAIAGHRTTHGAPFLDIDQLNPGDEITVETVDGTYTYAVEAQVDEAGDPVGHLIVRPEDVGVIMDKGDDRLTLTACHPRYSARQRIIVTAVLVAAPHPAPSITASDQTAQTPITVETPIPAETTTEPPAPPTAEITTEQPAPPTTRSVAAESLPFAELSFAEMAGSESLGWQARYAVPTGLWAAATTLIALLGWGLGRVWRRFPSYAMAVPPLTLSLYYCFVNLERFIPAV